MSRSQRGLAVLAAVAAACAAACLTAGSAHAQQPPAQQPSQPPEPPPPQTERSSPSPSPNRAVGAPVHVGFEGFASSVDEGSEGRTALGLGGLSLGVTLGDWGGVGVNQIHVASAPVLGDRRWAWGLAPFGEVFVFPMAPLQLYAQGGVAMQHRWDGQIGDELGVAPFGGVGLRVWPLRWLSFGAGLRGHVVATDGYMFSPRVLPRASVVGSGGLTLTFHIPVRRTP